MLGQPVSWVGQPRRSMWLPSGYSALLPIVSGKGSWMQGGMSQNFDLGPSFDFMKCRNLNIKKMKKSYPFFFT